jgi:iron(III) transport system ATP-binding protein
VAIARAIVYEPRILLLDEPLSNLDARLRERMRMEIRELQARLGITTLYVTHDQVEALTMSERIVVLDEGRVEQVGSPEELYERPRTRFVSECLGKTNTLSARVVSRLTGDGQANSVKVQLKDSDVYLQACTVNETVAEGDRLLVTIRPERVLLSKADRADTDEAASLGNTLHGEVQTSVFAGDHRQYQIRVAGQVVSVKSDSRLVLQEGERALVQFPQESLMVVPGYGSSLLAQIA